MSYMKATLASNGISEHINASNRCEILVSGLTSGSVKIQALFRGDVDFIDIPNSTFSSDTWQEMYISEPHVKLRVVGINNNAGVYVRIGTKG